MKAQEYYKKWSKIDWADDSQHFAERKFIELIAQYGYPSLDELEPQVPIYFQCNGETIKGAIDFVLDGKYPIEIDGENYHAPGKVPAERFDNLTAKQNAVINRYGNITRITYQMMKKNPDDAMGAVSKNIRKFKRENAEYKAKLVQFNDLEDRKAFEEREMKRRRDEFEKELREEVDALKRETTELGRTRDKLKTENANLHSKNTELAHNVQETRATLQNYQSWWQKHTRLVVGLTVSLILAIAAIVVGARFYDEQVKEAERQRQADERIAQIETGEICATADEAKQFVGKKGVCVEYYVNYVNNTNYGWIWINDKKNGSFSAFIKDSKVMSVEEAREYRNKTIEVHGDITEYKNDDGSITYEIIVGSKDQIKIKE